MIPYDWISFCDDNPAGPGVRWDSAWLERILSGYEWHVPGGYQFERRPLEPGEGGILIFPCGHYYQHREATRVLPMLQGLTKSMEWCILIATSDEGSRFPWWRFKPNHLTKLWVQTPRVDIKYPRGSRFFGFGSPTPVDHFPILGRNLDLFFSGQITHERRHQMWTALSAWHSNHHDRRVDYTGTEGFAHGLRPDLYRAYMADAKVVPAPSGPETQDSFRCYEALEAGAVPLQDALRPGGGGKGYWDLIGLNLMEIENWDDIGAKIDEAETPLVRAVVGAGWQQYKRKIVHQLHSDVMARVPRPDSDDPNDLITVVVPTSPSPFHPDIAIIRECIESVRERLPSAEILITCDGVRPQQEHRREIYFQYLDNLIEWTRTKYNIVPFLYHEHLHESGMLKDMIDEVQTPYLLYMEGDTTLIGEIEFEAVLSEMRSYNLNVMRFSHEANVLEPHKHLFLETKPNDDQHFIRTVQFSTRPSVWNVRWARRMLDTYVGWGARSMIEDMWYGPIQHGWAKPYTNRRQLMATWEAHRTAVWAPEENIKHSGHLDGRGDDPKYGMMMVYPTDEIPVGAPRPGWHKGEDE